MPRRQGKENLSERRAFQHPSSTFCVLLSAEPAFAQTNLESFGNAVLGLLSNGLLRIVAILALIAAGFGWLTGRVNTGALVTVIIGIAIIFSAPWIVDQLQG